MLFLLRKIRRKLMEKNKVTTYLLYAVGEIFLVVIGILIAVNINNWNSDRQQKSVQTKYLKNLRNDLEADIPSLDTMQLIAQRKVLAARNLRERSNKDSVGSLYDFSENLRQLIFVGEFTPNQSTLQEMMSTGNFSSLQNDSLKIRLLDLKRTYEFIESGQVHIRNDYEVFLETFEKHVDWGDFYNLPKTKTFDNMIFDSLRMETNRAVLEQDLRGLLRDKVFMNNIFLIDVNFGYFIPMYGSTKQEIEEVIQMIDREAAP